MSNRKGKRHKALGELPGVQEARKVPAGDVPERLVDWRHFLLVAFASFAVFANTLTMDFVSDDLYQIKDNTLIESLSNIPEIFTTEVWKGVKGGGNITPYYRPLFTLSYAVDHLFWGKRPVGYHLTNVLLHLLVSVSVYVLSLKVLKSKAAALFSGLVFAVHPVHSEAVTWLAARNESLTALFMLASLYLYILFRERQKTGLLGISLALFFLALLSKEMAVTLPVLIFLYEACFRPGDWTARLKWPIVYGLVLIPYFVIRSSVLEVSTWQDVPLSWRLLTSPGILVKYVRLLVLPLDLKVYYDLPVESTLSEPRVLIAMVVLIAILASVILAGRRDKRLLFGLLWIFIAVIPVSGIPTLIWPSPMAERYLYIPSVGLAFAAGLGMTLLFDKVSRSRAAMLQGHVGKAGAGVKVLAVSVIVLLFVLNFKHNYSWKDQFSYAKMVVRDAPNVEAGHNDLGVEYVKQGRIDDAIKELELALRLNPDSSEALSNLSALYRRQKRFDEAIAMLKESLKIRPRNSSAWNNLGVAYTDMGRFEEAVQAYSAVLSYETGFSEVHNNLGAVYTKQGRFDEAIKEFQIALKLEPRYAEAYYNLGLAYLNMGKSADAGREFRNALAIRPGYPEASEKLALLERGAQDAQAGANVHYNRGNELLNQGKFQEAIEAYRAALKQSPGDAEIHNNIGAAFVRLGKVREATGEFEKALKYRPGDAVIHYNLGLLYMKQGKVGESIEHLQAAVRLSPDKELFKKTLNRAYELQKKG